MNGIEAIQLLVLAMLLGFVLLMFIHPMPNGMEIFQGLSFGVAGIYMACEAKLNAAKRREQLEKEWEGKRDE